MAVTSANGVIVDKSWYLSKKVWLCVISLVVAVIQAATGHWSGVTGAEAVQRIAETASYLLPLLGTILALAHVDASTRGAALVAEALKAAATLDDADAPAAPASATANP